jgi:hypothetical protein
MMLAAETRLAVVRSAAQQRRRQHTPARLAAALAAAVAVCLVTVSCSAGKLYYNLQSFATMDYIRTALP